MNDKQVIAWIQQFKAQVVYIPGEPRQKPGIWDLTEDDEYENYKVVVFDPKGGYHDFEAPTVQQAVKDAWLYMRDTHGLDLTENIIGAGI